MPGKVYAFEPQSMLYKYLLTIKALFSSEIILENLALSDSKKEQLLNVPAHKNENKSSPGASLSNNFEGQKIIKTELIQSVSLDEYCKHSNIRPDFLKIDVEGHEVSVLKGAQKTILSSYPALLIEIEQRHNQKNINEIFDTICSMGYVGFYFQHNQLKTLQSFKVERDQNPNNFGSKKDTYINNFVFLHRDRIGRDEYRHLFFKWPVQ